MKRILFFCLAACLLMTGCYYRTESPRGSWAKGCDLSWLSEMEHDGMKFHRDDASNDETECMALLHSYGMNAVRLRVWVNHSTGWSNKEDMLYLAKRAAKEGMRLMIDIHYSDFFADPHQQNIPAAWQEYDYPTLRQAVQEHTLDVLNTLKEEGIKPEWVQIGNETPNGMLWPVGQLVYEDNNSNGCWDRYAGFTKVGYNAAKEVFPDINVIVHVDNAYEYRDWFWRAMKEHGGKWDIIGLSHYPMMAAWSGKTWPEMNDLAETNVRQLISEFHCPVMICEVGMMNYGVNRAEAKNYGEGEMYAQVEELSNMVMSDFVERMERIDSCMGIFYWEPEVYGGWRPAEYIPLGWGGYDMGSFTPEGKPSKALRTLLGSHHE